MKRTFLILSLCWFVLGSLKAQDTRDTVFPGIVDTSVRIVNFNPYFTLHVDSTLSYKFNINRDEHGFFWYLKNSPVGLKIDKDNGILSFRAEKNYFLSGKLKYDIPYVVTMGVQSLHDPSEKVDTNFTLIFYNTEIIPSKVKPTVAGTLVVEEGEAVSFKVQCETGSFPIEDILFTSSLPISSYSLVNACNAEFRWVPDYDFVKETDADKSKTVVLSFVGSTRARVRDTATVKLVVKDALNYPLVLQENKVLVKNIEVYILQLKYTFLQIEKRLKKTKSARTGFDLTSGSTAMAGTILSTSDNAGAQKTGKILPGVGVALVPIKEAAAPNKIVDQNQASLIRTSIKRLEYMLRDNIVVAEKDPEVLKKTNKLKEELKQIQIQLIDIPIEVTNNMTPEQLNDYFNSPKVNKKYRLSGK
jgi:hypothetical protein